MMRRMRQMVRKELTLSMDVYIDIPVPGIKDGDNRRPENRIKKVE